MEPSFSRSLAGTKKGLLAVAQGNLCGDAVVIIVVVLISVYLAAVDLALTKAIQAMLG